jgi:urease accessory protein
VLATGLLHLAGVGIGAFSGRPLGLAATRGLGALVAIAGVWFLWQAAGA